MALSLPTALARQSLHSSRVAVASLPASQRLASLASSSSPQQSSVPPRFPLSPSNPVLPGQSAGTIPPYLFGATRVYYAGGEGDKDPDPNKSKLGKTLKILQERLPTLLQYPLPTEILAPNVSLRLFPSTHPHLPTVSGRVAYNAALWTSPIAWNRVPIIGNVKLDIITERMTSEPLYLLPRRDGAIPEQLIVRWSEMCKTTDKDAESTRSFWSLWKGQGVDPNEAFSGIFIFDFDKQGRILTHTIEQTHEGGNWGKGVGAKFVDLTEWLLGGMKNPEEAPSPSI